MPANRVAEQPQPHRPPSWRDVAIDIDELRRYVDDDSTEERAPISAAEAARVLEEHGR